MEMYDPGPVTMGDLRRNGKALEIGCMNCNRHEYVDPHSIKLPDELPVPKVADRLRRTRCGFRNSPASSKVWARRDARPPA
jgi:hypothetical protein